MRKNINRTTVIIVLVIFLSISIGYALFSDTITIEGTATAQGTTDVIKTSCITNVSTDMLYNFGFEDDSKDGITVAERFREHGYKDVSCSVTNNDTVTYSVGFDYPGALKFYAIKIENTGNIPTVFNVSESIYETSASNTIKKYDMDDNLIETINNRDLPDWVDKAFFYTVNLMVQDLNGNYYYNGTDEYENNFLIEEDKIKLEPGESLYLLMYSNWPDEEVFKESNVKYVATSSFTIDWQQYTN